MSNLQTEVLEMEFNEFAHGSATIHEQDFARILLRYTTLTKQAHAQYLDRLARRTPHSQVLPLSRLAWRISVSQVTHHSSSVLSRLATVNVGVNLSVSQAGSVSLTFLL